MPLPLILLAAPALSTVTAEALMGCGGLIVFIAIARIKTDQQEEASISQDKAKIKEPPKINSKQTPVEVMSMVQNGLFTCSEYQVNMSKQSTLELSDTWKRIVKNIAPNEKEFEKMMAKVFQLIKDCEKDQLFMERLCKRTGEFLNASKNKTMSSDDIIQFCFEMKDIIDSKSYDFSADEDVSLLERPLTPIVF